MRKKILQALAVLLAACPVVALAQAPKDGVYISDEDIKTVLKRAVDTKRANPDNTIRVIDMDKYQLSVAVIHRGAMGGGANAGAAAANPSQACGEQRPGSAGPTGIFHDDTAESYVVISGSATLITGGAIVNGRRSPRIFSHRGSDYIPEHSAGSEEGSPARVRESGAQVRPGWHQAECSAAMSGTSVVLNRLEELKRAAFRDLVPEEGVEPRASRPTGFEVAQELLLPSLN
jgi:hypothetical protein